MTTKEKIKVIKAIGILIVTFTLCILVGVAYRKVMATLLVTPLTQFTLEDTLATVGVTGFCIYLVIQISESGAGFIKLMKE